MVSRICHVGAVANVDFKLCRSLLDGDKLRRKVESSSSEAEIVRIGAERLKIFQIRPEKRTSGLSFFALKGKSSSGFEFLRENGLAFHVFRNSLDFVYRKL